MTKNLSPKPFLSISAGLAACASPAVAEPAIPRDELVISATRAPTRMEEVGSSVTVILAEDIAARQYAFVADALRDAPGVAIARNGAFGGASSARIRGASSGETLVVIDGVVVNDPAAPQGGFNFANLDVADIDRIEVLRGPQSILYGADAIGGVISITTKTDQSSAGAFLEGGSFGTARGGATVNLRGNGAYGRLTVSGVRTDGISKAALGTEDDGFRSVAGSFRGGAEISPHWRAELIGRYGDAHAALDGFPPPFFALADTDDTEDTTDDAVAGRLLQTYDGYDGALTVSYNSIKRKDFGGGFETFSADGDRFSADYLAAEQVSDALRLIAGADVERTSVVVSGVDESANNGAVYGLLEAKLTPALTVSAGARRDAFSNFEGATTARVAAAWDGPAGLILRGSWGQGFRAPTLFELNYSQFGIMPNPDLRPERANGFDIGVEKSVPGLVLRATFFHTRVKDQIDFDFAGNGYFNIDETRSHGVEAEADWRINDYLSAQLSYSFVDAVDRATGEQLPRQPKHKGTAVVTATPVDRLSLSASVIVNGRENDSPAPNDAFVRLDLRAAYALTEKLELYGRVENATDADYQDVSGYGEPGLSGFGGVRVRL